MSCLAIIAERHIQEAIKRGVLDNLTLAGQPIPQEDLSDVPEELRMGYKVLKNAGYIPEELELQREIMTLKELVQTSTDPDSQESHKRKLTLRQLQFEMLMEKKGRSLIFQEYESKLHDQLCQSD